MVVEASRSSQRGILRLFKALFFPKAEALQRSPAESEIVPDMSRLSECDVPSVHFAHYFSHEGDPTHLSIRRCTQLPEGVSQRFEFCAVHNYGAIRHILTYSFETRDADGDILHGYVRELGTKPLVTGPYGPDEVSRLLSFELRSDGTAVSRALLARNAHFLAEIFAERGVDGVDDYLIRAKESLGPSYAFVERSIHFEEYLLEASSERGEW